MSDRTLADLLAARPLAWDELVSWIADAHHTVEVLPADPDRAEATLIAVQAGLDTALGAIAHGTGGLRIDDGWLRLLGSGHPRVGAGLRHWNGQGPGAWSGVAGALVVGFDAIGGVFAMNGGGLPGEAGSAHYLSPHTLTWEDLGMGYGGLVRWALQGDLGGFANAGRWPDWEEEVAALPGDMGIWRWPPPWSPAGRHRAEEHEALPLPALWERRVQARSRRQV
jgi:hypothetical protein